MTCYLSKQKKEGIYFQLPIPYVNAENFSYIAISKLLTDPNIKAAIKQVRRYCFDTGCENACITNGHEWIFFRTFERGKRWENLQAFVIRHLNFFKDDYTKAINSLSYTAISERSSLIELLSAGSHKDRTIYYPKEKINSYSHPISANKLASTLRPIVNYYFGVIGDNDAEFMDKCYVSQRDYQQTSAGMRSMLQDSLTPYFEEYGVQQLEDTGKGGRLGGRIAKNLRKGRNNEVLVLFGGKGSGKSTFIKRLLFHKTPSWLGSHAVISIIDLLNIPEDRKVIRAHIWSNLVKNLDRDGLLGSDRETILKLFHDKYLIAKNQELYGLTESSEAYNIKLNTLVEKWKSDNLYCALRLIEYWRNKNSGIVVVVDNTDQYSSQMQDFCFSSAQEISNALSCITIISMREERFYNSKIHGLLDAFQNCGFHISSPKPSEVFKKRLQYTISLLESNRRRRLKFGEIDSKVAAECCVYLKTLLKEFGNENSPLSNFLSACAHGDTRLSLDLFRSFVLSGYTNVDEMLHKGMWTFQIHQVIKPIMIPTRYFYDESLSNIPNVFQIRFSRNGSHFTALRILRKLSKNMNVGSPAYISVSELISYFSDTFAMSDDFIGNLDLLLKHGFVESSNRIGTYSISLDDVKITTYGLYMLNNLSSNMTYLELVSTDCGIYTEVVSNEIIEASRQEFGYFNRRERFERVKIRIGRVDSFIKYLEDEERREKEAFSLGMSKEDMFTTKMRTMYEIEKDRAIDSAKRQRH